MTVIIAGEGFRSFRQIIHAGTKSLLWRKDLGGSPNTLSFAESIGC